MRKYLQNANIKNKCNAWFVILLLLSLVGCTERDELECNSSEAQKTVVKIFQESFEKNNPSLKLMEIGSLSLDAMLPTSNDASIKKRNCSATIQLLTAPGTMTKIRETATTLTSDNVRMGVRMMESVLGNASLANSSAIPESQRDVRKKMDVAEEFLNSPLMATPDGGILSENINYSVQLTENGKTFYTSVMNTNIDLMRLASLLTTRTTIGLDKKQVAVVMDEPKNEGGVQDIKVQTDTSKLNKMVQFVSIYSCGDASTCLETTRKERFITSIRDTPEAQDKQENFVNKAIAANKQICVRGITREDKSSTDYDFESITESCT